MRSAARRALELVGPRHPEPLAARADARLRPRDALGDRRLGHEQGAGDLGGREPADGAEGERDLRGPAERRVAAEEEQRERVVDRRDRRRRGFELDGERLAAAARDIRPHLVDVAPRRDPHEPRARAVGHAVARPLGGCRDERLLHGVLARLEVAVAPHEHRERRRCGVSQCPDGVAHGIRWLTTSPRAAISSTGRTSMRPNSRLGESRRDLDGARLALDVDEVEAGEQLLRLGERAVARDRAAVGVGDALGERDVGERLTRDELAARGELVADALVVGVALGLLLGAEALPHRTRLGVAVDLDEVLHRNRSFDRSLSSFVREAEPRSHQYVEAGCDFSTGSRRSGCDSCVAGGCGARG